MNTKITRERFVLSLLCLSLALTALGVQRVMASQRKSSVIVNTQSVTISPSLPDGEVVIPPLPQIGGGPTPDGAACCINGMVWFNGAPVAGADVMLQILTRTVNVLTEVRFGSTSDEPRPYYQVSLYDPPLNAQVGEVMTITARFSGYSHVITHTVLEGNQQVDVNIPRTGLGVLGFSGDIRNTPVVTDVLRSPWAIASDRHGQIYIGDTNAARLKVYSPNGKVIREWGGYGNLPAQFGRISAIAVDQRDNVFVVDGDNLRTTKFTPDGTPLLSWSLDCTGCRATATGRLAIAIKPDGNVLINANNGLGWLNEFTPDGKFITVTPNGGLVGTFSILNNGVALDIVGNIYIADPRNNHVVKLNSQKQPVSGEMWESTVITGVLDVEISPDNSVYVIRPSLNGVTTIAERYTLTGTFQQSLTVPLGNVNDFTIAGDYLYLVGYAQSTVMTVTKTLTESGVWIQGVSNYGNNGLSSPRGMVVKGNDLYVTDCVQHTLTRFSPEKPLKAWTASEMGFGPLWCAMDIDIDRQGRFLAIDANNNKLYRFSIISDTVTFTSSLGVFGTGLGQFYYPFGIAVGRSNLLSDTIFIADTYNSRVQVLRIDSGNNLVPITATPALSGTAIGQYIAPLDIDVNDVGEVFVIDQANRLTKVQYSAGALIPIGIFTGTNPSFNRPSALAIAPNGHVYVVDTSSAHIYEVDFNNITGTLVNRYGGLSGNLVAPGSFLNPVGITFDSAGQMYVAQGGGFAPIIHKMTPMTSTIPVAAITALSNNAGLLDPSSTLTITGIGQTSDISRTILTYEWTFTSPFTSIPVTTTTNKPQLVISVNQLLPRLQYVSLRVIDSSGEWSHRALSNERIYVSVHPKAQPTIPTPTPTGETPPPTPITPTPPCLTPNWLFMVYASADNPDDGQALLDRLNAVVREIGGNVRNSCVVFAAQIDGPLSITSTTADTQRWIGESGKELTPVLTITEQAMDSAETLHDFVRWAQDTYTNTQYHYLAITNHGQGIIGTAWDFTTDHRPTSPLGPNDGSKFLRAANIADALTRPDIVPIDILHLDSCSMGLLDVAYELRDAAHYLIASQYLGWAIFGYDDYIKLIDSDIQPRQLAQNIVKTYSSIATKWALPHTLSALDLHQIDTIRTQIDELAVLLRGWLTADSSRVDRLIQIREDSQTYNSNHDLINSPTDVYVDLLSWARTLRATLTDPVLEKDIRDSSDRLIHLLESRDNLIVDSRSGNGALSDGICPMGLECSITFKLVGGISIYYPPEALQPAPKPQIKGITAHEAAPLPSVSIAPSQVYTDYVSQRSFQFTHVSRWDEFLGIALRSDMESIDDQFVMPPPLMPSYRLYLPLVRKQS